MIKFLVNITELTLILAVVGKTLKFLLKKDKKYKKSIIGKVGILISNKIHYKLDKAIQKQKKSLAVKEQDFSNVIKFEKHMRKSIK